MNRRSVLAGDSIAANLRAVRDHYEQYTDMLDREKSYEAEGWQRRPPIMNLGYWAHGAKTAREAQEDFVREFASRAPQLQGCRVLDLGCGLAGPATILAQDYGALVDGVNIVERQVKWARQFIAANDLTDQVRVHLASAMDLPFSDETFDLVFCLEAAHCFVDKTRFLREAQRALRPGGKLVMADITASSRLPFVSWQPALKLHLVKAEDWLRMIEATGFTVEERQLIGHAVYPGCRRWAAQTADVRRRAIFEKSCSSNAPAPVQQLMRLRAWALEFIFCRSVLLTFSQFGLREYVLFVARKPGLTREASPTLGHRSSPTVGH